MTSGPSTFVIAITPFDDDEHLDEQGLRGHLQRLAASGIGVYLGGSGSGEGYTLVPDEVKRVLEIGVEELRGRVPVRAMGVEPRSGQQMIELGRVATDAGVDAMQVYSLDQGHGNAPRPVELERYFRDVLDAVDLPVVLSSHQSVGYSLPIDLIDALLNDYDSIIGVHCTNNDLPYLVRVIDAVADRAEVHVGGPMHALSCIALGGAGYLSSEGNLAPRLCVSLTEAYGRGDLDAACMAYARLMHLHTELRRLGGINATKAALELLALPGGAVRRPRLPVTDDVRNELNNMLDTLDIRAVEGIR